jgi:ribonuclease HII
MLKQFYEKDKIEVGLDEVGRGCLFGPVCVAGVVWLDNDPEPQLEIRDSKKVPEKKRTLLKDYILENSIAYSIQLVDNDYIDKFNILNSTMTGMHKCLDEITELLSIDTILVDGNHFEYYSDKYDNYINHVCVVNGDNTYKSIAAASILAKTYRDEWINKLVDENPELEKYDLRNNKGYGTKRHLDAIKQYGITRWHRKSFGICNSM